MTEPPWRYPRGQIAVLTRAPVEGKVKTRLASVAGTAQALQVHIELLTDTLAKAARARLAPVSLWVAGGDSDDRLISTLAAAHAVPVHAQVGADLGQRMAGVVNRVLREADFCILIGTDCPALDADYLARACAALEAGRDMVLGSAEDGGYVLLGLREHRPALFRSMPWGTDRVSARTVSAAQALGLDYVELPVLWDLDLPADLVRYRELSVRS
jgi:hypothetical protein